jgi:putative SOS response-associated peptidase YedK
MCGRYVTPEVAAMERYWHIGRHNWLPFILPHFNVAPTTQVPIIIFGEDGSLEGHIARWGLIPHWWKRPDPPAATFNARAEEAAEKPTWRDALKSRRCLMPVRGWYEWRAMPGSSRKQPYFVHAMQDEPLAFAGLWSRWRPADAEPVLSCAVLTKQAAASIADIHHRMPVVLRPEHFNEWLDPATDADRIQEILADARTDLQGYPVSTAVNSTRNNSPELLTQVQSPSGEQIPAAGGSK